MVHTSSLSLPLALSLLGALASSSTSSASPTTQHQEAGSSSKQAYRYALAKRSRSFQDANGLFDVSAFQKEKEMVAQKYAHSNARYRRNLEQGKVKVRSRRSHTIQEEEQPVYDMATRQYIHTGSRSRQSKRQSSSSSSGTTGSVELTDCKCVFHHVSFAP